MSDRDNATSEKERTTMELPLALLPSVHPCSDCGECCRYVAVEIDKPTAFGDYENLHWYLTHRDVAVYIDWEGDWYIEFTTTCEHQATEGTCGIYEERPKICSDFSWEECEVSVKEPAWRYRFDAPDKLWAWMQEKRPKAWEKLQRARKRLLEKRGAARETAQKRQKAGAPLVSPVQPEAQP